MGSLDCFNLIRNLLSVGLRTMQLLHGGSPHGDMASESPMDMSANATAAMGGMTFLPWESYKVQLLFAGWNVSQPWQFALTWFVVMLAAVSLHILDCVSLSLKRSMITMLLQYGAVEAVDKCGDVTVVFPIEKIKRPMGWQAVKIVHGLLTGTRYGLSLLLMLVAMTFNPSLFLALVVGYIFGDYLCCDFHIDMKMGVYNTPRGGLAGPFLQRLLCQRKPGDKNETASLINQPESIVIC